MENIKLIDFVADHLHDAEVVAVHWSQMPMDGRLPYDPPMRIECVMRGDVFYTDVVCSVVNNARK